MASAYRSVDHGELELDARSASSSGGLSAAPYNHSRRYTRAVIGHAAGCRDSLSFDMEAMP